MYHFLGYHFFRHFLGVWGCVGVYVGVGVGGQNLCSVGFEPGPFRQMLSNCCTAHLCCCRTVLLFPTVDGLLTYCSWTGDGFLLHCCWTVDGLWMGCGWAVDGLLHDC